MIFLGYVFDIDGTSLPHETIECLRTWPSDDDIKEAIRTGYDEAMALANYLEINNRNLTSIQQQISFIETSSDNTNASEIVDNENDQSQDFGMKLICLLVQIFIKSFVKLPFYIRTS